MIRQTTGRRQEETGTTSMPATCALCGARLGHVYMWTADGRRVHIDCYAAALVRAARTEGAG